MWLYIILAIVFIVFVVFVVKSYAKKINSGCCGGGGDAEKKIKVADKNKSHYPYSAVLTVDGMMCSGCETKVENALNVIDGVWAKANASSGKVDVLMKKPVDENVLRKAVNDIGVYTVMKAEFADAK